MTHTISRGRGSRAVRTAAAAGAVALGLATLSACEKPTPRATVTVGSSSVSTEAADGCYGEDKPLSQEKVLACAQNKKSAEESITVGDGDTVRIGTDPEMAESGWVLFINGQPALTEPIKKTYRSFPGDAFFSRQTPQGGTEQADTVVLSLVEYDGSDYHGVWNIELKSE